MKVIRALFIRFWENRLYDVSAQQAYYFLMSMFPFLVVVFTLLGYFPVSSETVLNLIKPYAPPNAYELIRANLDSILNNRRGHVLSISLAGTIWLTFMGVQSVVRSLNYAYEVVKPRPWLRELGIGLLLTVGIIFGVVTSLLLPVFGSVIGRSVAIVLGLPPVFLLQWNIARWLFSSLLLFAVFISLYIIAPNTRVKGKHALPGAVFATVGWQAISLGFSWYVSFANYTLIYGNLGSIIVLMIWFYLSAMILLLGGLLNATLYGRKAEGNQKGEEGV